VKNLFRPKDETGVITATMWNDVARHVHGDGDWRPRVHQRIYRQMERVQQKSGAVRCGSRVGRGIIISIILIIRSFANKILYRISFTYMPII